MSAIYDINIEQAGRGSAAATVDLYAGVPRLSVLGAIGGVDTPKVIKNTNANASTFLGFRYTVNPGDDIVAADRLVEGGLDTGLVMPATQKIIGVPGRDAVTIYVVAVANVAYANASGTIIPTGSTTALTTQAFSRFVFPAGTRVISLEMAPTYIISSVTYGLLSLRGYIDG